MRVPRRLARVGAADDLPDAVAFDAYVGPSGEITVDHIRGIIALHDGSTPGGFQFTVGGGADTASRGVPGGRLTLTPGAAAPEADVASATSLHYVPFGASTVPVDTGSGFTFLNIPSGLSIALDSNSGHAGYHQSGKNFDVFAYNAGGGDIGIGTGPAWSSDTSRGTGAATTELTSLSGFFVNAVSISLRIGSGSGDVVTIGSGEATYLGSFRPTANGTATDTKAKRLVFNAYNAVERLMAKPTTANFSYTTPAYIPYENSATNKLEMLLGLVGVPVRARASISVLPDSGGVRLVRTKVGLDSDSIPSLDCTGTNAHAPASCLTHLFSEYEGYPGLGYHYLVPLMYGSGDGTQSWIGSDSDMTTGIFGSAFL